MGSELGFGSWRGFSLGGGGSGEYWEWQEQNSGHLEFEMKDCGAQEPKVCSQMPQSKSFLNHTLAM